MPRVVQLDLLIAPSVAASIDVVAGDPTACSIGGVTEDSREVRPGDLFVARTGRATDGARFARSAVEAGAVAVLGGLDDGIDLPADVVRLAAADPGETGARLAFAFHDHPEHALDVVGITGTNGKTTIATLARQLAAATVGPTGSIGTVEIHDGTHARPAHLTTPGRIELARTLAGFVEAGTPRVMLEVSSQGLDQGRVGDLPFRIGVFTNLSGDHLDYHGSMEAYERAKAILFESLDADAFAISNLDDPVGIRMLERTRARGIGITTDADATDDDLAGRILVSSHPIDATGMRLRLEGSGCVEGSIEADVPLVGGHNAFNVAAAVAIVRCLGGEAAAIEAALERVEAPAGRLEPVHGPSDDVSVFVDYAHSDDSLRNVLAAVRGIVPAGDALWVVFGAGGDRDASKRPRMMRAALDGADHVVVTSDNPRTEDPARIVADVVAGAIEAESRRVEACVDRAEAIRHAVATAPAGTILVIAGKGHETYQLVGRERRFFDDRAAAADALRARRGGGS